MASAAQALGVETVSLNMVEAGIPLEALTNFAESSGLTLAEICDIVIPLRTLKHRRSRGESLTRDESDKFARLVRLVELATAVFANPQKALWWLHQPEPEFGDRNRLTMIQTDLGGRKVEEKLIQIDEGMFA